MTIFYWETWELASDGSEGVVFSSGGFSVNNNLKKNSEGNTGGTKPAEEESE